jgi:hypothetical protein
MLGSGTRAERFVMRRIQCTTNGKLWALLGQPRSSKMPMFIPPVQHIVPLGRTSSVCSSLSTERCRALASLQFQWRVVRAAEENRERVDFFMYHTGEFKMWTPSQCYWHYSSEPNENPGRILPLSEMLVRTYMFGVVWRFWILVQEKLGTLHTGTAYTVIIKSLGRLWLVVSEIYFLHLIWAR